MIAAFCQLSEFDKGPHAERVCIAYEYVA